MVKYVEVTSSPVEMEKVAVKRFHEHYKPGFVAEGPLTPADKAVVLFKEDGKPIFLIGIFNDARVVVTEPVEIDANCYQARSDSKISATLADAPLADWLREFVAANERLPVDISSWRKVLEPKVNK